MNNLHEDQANILSELILLATDTEIQYWLREIDTDELVQLMIYHLSEKSKKTILQNMSTRANEMINKDIDKMQEIVKRNSEILLNKINDPNIKKSPYVILFTDLVGSTEKMRMFGDADYYSNILSEHNRILTDAFNRYYGRIIKEIGDAYLVTFSDLDKAIICCLHIKNEIYLINKDRIFDNEIHIKMALHHGYIEYKKMHSGIIDIYGTAVNYAARLINEAKGDQIIISSDYFEILKKPPFDRKTDPELLKRIKLIGKKYFKGFEGEQCYYIIN